MSTGVDECSVAAPDATVLRGVGSSALGKNGDERQQAQQQLPAENKIPRDLSSADVYTIAIALICQTSEGRSLPVGYVDGLVRGAYTLQQLKLYREKGAPIGFAIWSYLSEAVESRLLSGGSLLQPSELKSGDRPWVAAVVAPFGHANQIRVDLSGALFGPTGYREVPSTAAGPVAEFAHRPATTAPMTQSTVSRSVTYRPARRDDAHSLAPRLREQDKTELFDYGGVDALTALEESFDNAKQCWSMLLDGRVIAMFGVGHIGGRPRAGKIWMLGSDEVFQQGRVLLYDMPIWLHEFMKGHDVLENFVGADNEAYIRWLKRLGFKFVRLNTNFGVGGKPFWEFFVTVSDLSRSDVR